MINVKLIKHSESLTTGVEILTYELEYPRFIHSEFMTHRMLSKNAASSRAIPIDTLIGLAETNIAMPVYWGANKAGMQASEEVEDVTNAQLTWISAAESAVESAHNLKKAGLHKQIVNRVLEPFTNIKVVVTGTDWENFFWLRNHSDAQPEIKELARLMQEAKDNSNPQVLNPGEWHLPYIHSYRNSDNKLVYCDSETSVEYDLETARKISVSCCAQVSYRKNDTSVEKALNIFKRLIESEPIHASPTEHQATPIGIWNENDVEILIREFKTWPDGVTHVNRDGELHSGNLREWIQFRQLLPNNVKRG